MAEWVQARTDLDTDPVVIRQAAALSIPALSVAFLWIKFWGWAREHTVTGRIDSVTHEVVDAAIGVRGFAQSAGHWLLFDEAGLTIPKWEKHNDNGARKRFLARNRQENKRNKASRSRHAGVTQERDSSVTRREEIREDVNTKPPLSPKGEGGGGGRGSVSLRFAEFWQAFPSGIPNRKQDRKKCSEVWAAKKLDDQADRILADVKAKRTGEKWTKDKGAFIEAPLVYLNNERWMDQDAPGSTFDWKGRWQALPDQTRQEWTQAFRIETKDRQTRPGEFGEWVSARLERVGGAA